MVLLPFNDVGETSLSRISIPRLDFRRRHYLNSAIMVVVVCCSRACTVARLTLLDPASKY